MKQSLGSTCNCQWPMIYWYVTGTSVAIRPCKCAVTIICLFICADRDTRTAEGPNSFSKGKLGFCNRQKVMMRELEENSQEQSKK